MDDVKTGKAGRVLWGLAGALLLVLWLAGMSLDDDRLCSSVPLCMGFAAVLVLAVAGMVVGARPARPTLTCLFGVAVGGFFLIRCVSGDMLSEMWRELPLILAAYVFYGAGYLLAQRRGGEALTLALALGVVVNIAFFFLLRDGLIPIEATGRPSMSLAGANSPGTTLFTYKNFSAIFLMVAGGVLICRPIWAGWKGGRSLLVCLVGMLGVVCSCLCGSRAVLLLLPLMVVSAWVLWLIIRLYSEKHIGYGVVLSGLALFVGGGVLLGELFMGDSLMQQILSIDTHKRTDLWGCIIDILPEVPWCGLGAGATQWMLVPFIDDHFVPNYAHNDYLQAWVDYGAVGIGLLLAVLVTHLASGFWSLASEDIDRERRAQVAACMLVLLAFAGCAMVDFVWHNVALVGTTAFACGMLASPIPSRREAWFKPRRNWAANSRPALRPVRPVGRLAATLCCICCISLAANCVYFAWRLLPAWQAQWEYNALCRAGASEGERVEFLERVMPFYPDPELVDHYMTLRPPAVRRDQDARKESMLRMALKSNPHQLFTVVMLSDVLSRTGRYEEAEALLRKHYAPGGQPGTKLANWPVYYGMNLLTWGHERMARGEHAIALSMMEYALNIWGHADGFQYRTSVSSVDTRKRNKATAVYVAARRVDVDMLHAIGVEKDDSWKRPMSPGGPSALYERWENQPHSRKYTDPYARRSPLKL